jgi:hypothetical protein
VTRDQALMQVEGNVGDKHLRRRPKLPQTCSRPQPTGQLAVFDQFWTDYAENYPFFKAKGIDWSAGYLRMIAFLGYGNIPDYNAERIALNRALDQALKNAANLRGMILDLRINGGGSDQLALDVAASGTPVRWRFSPADLS